MDWLASIFTAQVLGPVISLIVTAIIGWVAMLYTKITGSQLEANHRSALQSALENGINGAITLLLNRGKQLLADGRVATADQSAVLMDARAYVKSSVPDAVAHFELNDGKLNELLMPKLPQGADELVRPTPVRTRVSP